MINFLFNDCAVQIIRTDGPESHLLTKVGTPTMGGVPMLFGVSVATLVWSATEKTFTPGPSRCFDR